MGICVRRQTHGNTIQRHLKPNCQQPACQRQARGIAFEESYTRAMPEVLATPCVEFPNPITVVSAHDQQLPTLGADPVCADTVFPSPINWPRQDSRHYSQCCAAAGSAGQQTLNRYKRGRRGPEGIDPPRGHVTLTLHPAEPEWVVDLSRNLEKSGRAQTA